jgi:HEPN domain-containing protein
MNRAADRLRKAERDLGAAEDFAATGHHEWAAFQAQHRAEKAVKALVQSLHGAVRGHSVSEIQRQLTGRVAVPPELIPLSHSSPAACLAGIPRAGGLTSAAGGR